MRKIFALLLMPTVVNAGTVYDIAIRPVEQSRLEPAVSTGTPIVTQYFVDQGKVRVGGDRAKSVYLFKDRILYVIDNPSRTVHVLEHATLSQTAAHYGDALRQLEETARDAPSDQRAEAQQKVAAMQAVSERLLQPVPRDYRATARFESVDGRACRIWEEYEGESKHLELCVAPTATVPGGADILSGMKTLGLFRQGSDVALGVEFGLSEWWPDIARLGGLPLLIREYRYDGVVAEIMLTAIRTEVPCGMLLDVPDGYQVQKGPDYTLWYVR